MKLHLVPDPGKASADLKARPYRTRQSQANLQPAVARARYKGQSGPRNPTRGRVKCFQEEDEIEDKNVLSLVMCTDLCKGERTSFELGDIRAAIEQLPFFGKEAIADQKPDRLFKDSC